MDTFLSTQRKNAPHTIAAIVKQIEDKSRELQSVSDSIIGEKVVLASIKKEIEQANSRLAILREQIVSEEKEYESIVAAKNELKEFRSQISRDIKIKEEQRDKISQDITTVSSDLDVLEKRKQEIEKRKEQASQESKGARADLNEVSDELERVTLTIIKKKDELKFLENRKDRVLGEITEALDKFSIVEKRIATFSRETGYQINYQVPN